MNESVLYDLSGIFYENESIEMIDYSLNSHFI